MYSILIHRNSNNIAKGYTNIGLIQNLETTISGIASVPATFDVSLSLGNLLAK